VRHISDRVLVFKDGRIVEEGEAERVFAAPEHAYTKLLMSSTPAFRRSTLDNKIRTEGQVPEREIS